MQTRTLAGRNSVDSFNFGVHPGDVEVRRHLLSTSSARSRSRCIDATRSRTPSSSPCCGQASSPRLAPAHGVGRRLTRRRGLQTPPYPLACNGIPVDSDGYRRRQLVEWRPRTDRRPRRTVPRPCLRGCMARDHRTGRNMSTEERLYRLGTLRTPSGVTGTARLATDDDRGQLVEWVELFFQETFSQRDEAAGGRFVDTANQVGDRFMLWEVDGTPVSMAMLRAPAAECRASGRSSRRSPNVDTATARPSPPRPRISHTAAAPQRSCSSRTWPTPYRTRSIRGSGSNPSPTAFGSSSSLSADCERAQTAHNARRVGVQTPS